MSVHPDKTAWRAIDALGGTYSCEEVSSGFAMGHGLAIAEAMGAVQAADDLTAELLEALQALAAVAEMTTFSDQFPAECEAARAAIAKATGAA